MDACRAREQFCVARVRALLERRRADQAALDEVRPVGHRAGDSKATKCPSSPFGVVYWTITAVTGLAPLVMLSLTGRVTGPAKPEPSSTVPLPARPGRARWPAASPAACRYRACPRS